MSAEIPEGPPHQSPPITTELAAEWIKVLPGLDEFDDPTVTFDRGSGPEQAMIFDAVIKRVTDGPNIPIVVLEKPDGSREEVLAADYLRWRGQSPESIHDQINTTKEPQESQPVERLGGVALTRALSQHEQDEERNASRVRRAEKLFAAVEIGGDGLIPVTSYDHLFSPDDNRIYTVEDAAVRPKASRGVVTPESERDAAEWLRFATLTDGKIHEIIFENPSVDRSKMPLLKIEEVLRTNTALRIELGSYLLNKLDRRDVILRMPERVISDTGKSPSHPGYEDLNLTSREYVVMLAIAMLDGTFIGERVATGDMPSQDRSQHRYAANQLLSTPGDQGVIEQRYFI